MNDAARKETPLHPAPDYDWPDTTTPRPVPAWLRYGALGLLALIGIAAVFLISRSGPSVPSDSALERAVEIEAVDTPNAPAPEPVLTSAGPIESDVRQAPAQPAEQSERAPVIAAHARQQAIEALDLGRANEDRLTGLDDRLARQNERLASLQNTLETALATQRTELDALRQALDAFQIEAEKKVQAAKTRSSTPPKKRRPKPSVPFELIAIDSWNQAPNALIRANGALYRLPEGAALFGWTVETIDETGRAVTLSNGRAGAVRLRLGG